MGAINPNQVSTHSFNWGMIKWFVTPEQTESAKVTCGEVILLPEQGHERHNHPDAEEILYVLSGEGEQMVNDEQPFAIKAGDIIYIPQGIYHSTYNVGWEPLRLLAFYNPGGAEKGLTALPDFKEIPAGKMQGYIRAE
ncbi:cupin domain-containing protein [Brevibacillus fulvus]|uniref:Oxalate decarboxylase/phosphoglucose isomerase-like protein (Cupin superfamily) n=1 Tax=Brevibacillus fulvus TaxID=1125967 RepID=A0A938Y3F1_9BACL|nr:cupin domain-containing protein [Brevibacillus fulvus]MBM7591246.1 oxalate decarboxylase/phosphoglucose isomerase-like protein (cupin superfamily) [Brevibacillus fulvus]